MQNNALKLEKKYLAISVLGNAILGSVGLLAAAFSRSHAILMDGVFNVAYLAIGLFAIKVATLVSAGDDDEFPYGYAYLEPLVNGLKGTLVFGVSLMAVIASIVTLLGPGREVHAGLAIGYGIFATATCALVGWLVYSGSRQTASPMVRADAENWMVNTAVSSCVVIAFGGVFLLRWFNLDRYAPYVDPLVVLAVVLISIYVPVRMMWDALMRLLNRAPADSIRTVVVDAVRDALAGLPVQETFVRVLQPGRQRMVLVHAILPPDHPAVAIEQLDDVRSRMFRSLNNIHDGTIVDLQFSKDRQWGAPLADGGSGGPATRA